MSARYWNDTKIIKLINLVEKSPALWQGKTSKHEKEILWKKIAKELEIPLPIVNKKFNELTHAYKIVVRKTQSGKKNYKPTWKYFHQLNFLNETSSEQLDDINFCVDQPNETEEFKMSSNAAEIETDSIPIIKNGKDVWTYEKKIQFIELLRKNLKLFNKNKTNEIEKLWQDVADEMGMDIEAVKLQKTLLSAHFFSQYANARKDLSFKSAWAYYEPLLFLADIDKLHKNDDDGKNELETDDETFEKDFESVSSKRFKVSTVNDWNCENTIKFINLVRAHNVIWDDSNPSFIETTAQKNAWEEIVNEMNLPLDILKEKFKSLCSTYYSLRREIAKDPLYIIGWVYFSYMEFLPLPKSVLKTIAAAQAKKIAAKIDERQNICESNDSKKSQKNSSRLSVNTIDDDEMELEIDVEEAKQQVQEKEISSTSKSHFNNFDNEVEISDLLVFHGSNKQHTIETVEDEADYEDELEATTKARNLKQHKIKILDEHDIFGQVVANELRKMCDFKEIQNDFKQKVKKVLSKTNAEQRCRDSRI